jgi:hypothetical protein
LVVPTESQVEKAQPAAPLLEAREFERWIGKPTGQAVKTPDPPPVPAANPNPEPAGKVEEQPPFWIGDEDLPADEVALPKRWPASPTRSSATADVPPISGFWLLILSFLLSAAMFLLGLLVGRYIVPAERPAAKGSFESAPATNPVPQKAARSDEPNADNAPTERSGQRYAIKGAIRYREVDRDVPDVGAVVLVFPTQPPARKFASVGLRPEDYGMPDATGAKELRLYGGTLAIVRDDGTFAVDLPQKGAYYVLALSQHARRKNEKLYVNERATLAKYFANPDELLGGRDFVLVPRKLPDNQADPVEYTF